MDVRQQEMAEIFDGEPARSEPRLEPIETAGWATVHERRLVPGEEIGSDDPRAPEVLQVD
jgi:hypothetical protein